MNIARARAQLGFEPQVTLRAGMAEQFGVAARRRTLKVRAAPPDPKLRPRVDRGLRHSSSQ